MLDLAICSHNDTDHANGFIALLQSKIRIKEIWLPSFWLSILQYVQEHGFDWSEIDRRNEEINKRIKKGLSPDMIFSKDSKPITNDESNMTLSYFAEYCDYDNNGYFRDKLVYYVIDSVEHQLDGIKSQAIVRKVAESVIDNLIIVPDYVNDVVYIVTKVITRMYNNLGDEPDKYNNKLIKQTLLEVLSDVGHENLIKSSTSVKDLKKIKGYFGNIRNIAGLAYRRGCKIKWFEPTQGCPCNQVDKTGFIALNSDECQVSRIQDNIMAFALALHLTEVNEYSLAFEYLKDGIPIIRFSADSDCPCQSQYPYSENIIVTAPHHGSAANAKVYSAIQGDDIIWVRSDKVSRSQGRPCDAFKSMKKKYCLACEACNFISEICFEYDPWNLQWQYVRGEQCRCKP